MKLNILRTWLHGAVALVLAACGGGGDGGIGGTGNTQGDVSIGTITNFGSVWVNGVRFNSDNAVIKRDDSTVDKSLGIDRKGGLRRGMQARVDGSISGATAQTITVKSAAKGRIETTPSATQIVVLGQTITIDSSTLIEDNVTLAQNDYVEVHGMVVAAGKISAGYIERKTTLDSPPYAVRGIVSGHTAGGTTFNIGSLTVSTNGAITSDMPSGPWDGLMVEVKGSNCSGVAPVCGTLTATKVEPEDVKGDVGAAEIEGFVTALNVDGFNIGSQKIVTTGAVYVGGIAADLVVGTKVEVEGSISAGVLLARKVSFRESIRIEGNATPNVSTSSLTIAGLSGITVEVNSLTKFSGVVGLANISAGSHIEVRGRPGLGNNVVATEIKTGGGGNANRVILQAIATVSGTNVTLLGITFDASAMSTFKDVNDNVINSTQFFSLATTGKLIKARGGLNGSTVTWNQEIQLEE